MLNSQTVLNELGAQLLSGEIEIVDLTAVLGPETPIVKLPPVFGQAPQIEMTRISRYDQEGPEWAWNTLTLSEHSGTHFDAPIHWITGKDHPDGATDTIPAQRFVGPLKVIDCSREAAQDSDFILTLDHVKAWEELHGPIQEGDWVAMRTDWWKRSGSAAEFLSADETGSHYPGPSVDTVLYLVDKGIAGWGSETISTDAGIGPTFDPPQPVHYYMHQRSRYGLACLCNLDRVPATGAIIIAAPLKIANGTGSPIRALAMVPRC